MPEVGARIRVVVENRFNACGDVRIYLIGHIEGFHVFLDLWGGRGPTNDSAHVLVLQAPSQRQLGGRAA
jgi:hypothetical protein